MPKKNIRKQYYLNPFPGKDDYAINMSAQKYGYKTNCTVLDASKNCMATIESYATLIIDGHGSSENQQLLMTENGAAIYTVDTMAMSLKIYWKLPKTHVKIRLLGCKGYGFARNLALALKLRDYNSICVAGYRGNVATGAWEEGTGRGPNPTLDEEGNNYYGKDRIVWYNGNGDEVLKPVDDRAIVGESTSDWN